MLFLVLVSNGTHSEYISFISPIVNHTYTMQSRKYITLHSNNTFSHSHKDSPMEISDIRPSSLTFKQQVPLGAPWRPQRRLPACLLANQERMRVPASQSRECVPFGYLGMSAHVQVHPRSIASLIILCLLGFYRAIL